MPHYSVALDSVAHYAREVSVPFSDAATGAEACALAMGREQGLDRPFPTGSDGVGWDLGGETLRTRSLHVATGPDDVHRIEVSLKAWANRNECVEADDPDAAVEAAADTEDPPRWPARFDDWRCILVELLDACDSETLDGPDLDEPEYEAGDEEDEEDEEDVIWITHSPR